MITLPDRLWALTLRMKDGHEFTVGEIARKLGVSKSPQLYGLLRQGVTSGHFRVEFRPLSNGMHLHVYVRTSLDAVRSPLHLESKVRGE